MNGWGREGVKGNWWGREGVKGNGWGREGVKGNGWGFGGWVEIVGLDGAGVEIQVCGAGILLKDGRWVWLQELDGKGWRLRGGGWRVGVGEGLRGEGEGRICGLEGGGPDQDR